MTNSIDSTTAQVSLATARAASVINPTPASVPGTTEPVVVQPAASATISNSARLQAAATTAAPAQASTAASPVVERRSAPIAKIASAGQVGSALASSTASQTSTTSYVAKVRAALALNPSASVSSVMAKLGIPQAEQQQVSSALGSNSAPAQQSAASKS